MPHLSESHVIKDLLEKNSRDYLMSKTKIRMNTSVENLDAGDYKLEKAAEGEQVEVPRWMAEEFVSMNLAVAEEEPFEVEVSRALSREKMMGPLQLSALPPEFYARMQRRIATLRRGVEDGKTKKEEFERMRNGCYDLIGMRLSKLLSLSSSSAPASTLADKLTPEEMAFFSASQSLSKEWKGVLLGDVK